MTAGSKLDVLKSNVRRGMNVVTSDGELLGKAVQIHLGSDSGERHSLPQLTPEAADVDTEGAEGETAVASISETVPDAVLEVEVGQGDTMYVPYQAIAAIEDDAVQLYVDRGAARASAWREQPYWMTDSGAPEPSSTKTGK